MKFKMHKEAGKLRATCRKVERKEDIPQFLITAGAVKVNDSNSVTMIASRVLLPVSSPSSFLGKKPPSFSVAMVRGLKIMASPLSLLTRRVVAMIRLPTLPLLCWCMVRICRNRSQRWTASKLPMANAASTLRGAKSVRLRCLRKTANTPLFSWITVMAV